jgi:hypothetical protein
MYIGFKKELVASTFLVLSTFLVDTSLSKV